MATYTYVSGPFDQASSWLVGGTPPMNPPGAGDDVDFPSGGSPTGNGSVMSVSIEGAFTLASGSIQSQSVSATAAVTINGGGDLNSSGPLDFSDDVTIQGGGSLEGGGSSDTFSGDDLTVDGDGSSFTEAENFQAIGPTDVTFSDGADVTTGNNPADTDLFEGASTLLLTTDATFTAADITTGDGSTWTIDQGASLNTTGGGNEAGGGAVGAALNGTGTVDGATVTSAGGWSIGSGAPFDGGPPLGFTGTATFTDAANVTLGSLFLGDYTGADGDLTVSGEGTSVTLAGDTSVEQAAGILLVGNDGSGELTIDQGATFTVNLTSTLAPDAVGFDSGSEGTLDVDGSGSNLLVNGSLDVGDGGMGEVTIEASGAATISSTGTLALVVGDEQGATGTVDVTGSDSKLSVAGTVTVGNSGLGLVTIEAEAAATFAALIIAAMSTSGTASAPDIVTANGDGSTLTVTGDVTIDSAMPLAQNSDGKTNGTGGKWSYSDSGFGQLAASDSGNVTIGGTLTLQAPGTGDVAADVTIDGGGSIEVGGHGQGQDDALVVDAGGLVVGAGTISASADAGQVVAAGTVEAKQGTLELDANVSGSGDGVFLIDIDATLKIDGTADAGAIVNFSTAYTLDNQGYSTTLVLEDPQGFKGTIENFTQGDTIDLPDFQPSKDFIGATYSDQFLSVQGVGTLALIGTDPIPTIGFKPDGNGGTDIETVSVQTLLDLAMNTYHAPFAGADNYKMIATAPEDDGFEAVAYMDQNTDDTDPSIVIAYRGTSTSSIPAFVKNAFADSSFLTGIPNGLLTRYVSDAADFLFNVVADNPTAEITLTGHSLGGALAQLVGEASGFATAGFDAPGTGQLYSQLTGALSLADNLGDGGTNINYRVTGDQVSFAGTPIRQTYSVQSTVNTNGATPFPVAALQVLTNHLQFPAMQTATYTEGFTDPDYITQLQQSVQSVNGTVLRIVLHVAAGVLSVLDPGPGASFVLAGDAGSPDISSIVFPLEPGVANYNVAYQIGSTTSSFSLVKPGATDTLPAGVNAVTFDPLDAGNSPVVISASFYLTLGFASGGTFNGTLTESGSTEYGQPVTSPISVTLQPAATAEPLGIPTPTDPSDSNPADFGTIVTALPTDATVLLPDGTTKVTLGEALTTAQLTGLEATPNAGAGGESSTFAYTVTDGDFASADGAATVAVACYVKGTRIATPRGAVAVEHLAVGDRVRTKFGGTVPVRWIGHRDIVCDRHARPADVRPVRIAAHAFATGKPKRDLLLSPDHAVLVDGVLIPVRYLINGTTIAQEAWPEVSYWHVELPSHDILFAEGLPAESYLDTGNRGAFANGGEAVHLHADFARRVWVDRACAPLVLDGPALHAARAGLLKRARLLGYDQTSDAALHLLAGEHIVVPEVEGPTHRFRLPPTACGVRLVSRAAIPAHTRADSTDFRNLGVAVARVVLDGQAIPLDDGRLSSGWHGHEPGWRWTDGDAGLAVAGGRILEITVAMTERYYVAAGRTRRSASFG